MSSCPVVTVLPALPTCCFPAQSCPAPHSSSSLSSRASPRDRPPSQHLPCTGQAGGGGGTAAQEGPRTLCGALASADGGSAPPSASTYLSGSRRVQGNRVCTLCGQTRGSDTGLFAFIRSARVCRLPAVTSPGAQVLGYAGETQGRGRLGGVCGLLRLRPEHPRSAGLLGLSATRWRRPTGNAVPPGDLRASPGGRRVGPSAALRPVPEALSVDRPGCRGAAFAFRTSPQVTLMLLVPGPPRGPPRQRPRSPVLCPLLPNPPGSGSMNSLDLPAAWGLMAPFHSW